MKKTLFIVTVLLLVAAFGISAFMVGNYLLDGKKQADRMDDLSQIVSNAQTETTEETEETTEETAETSVRSQRELDSTNARLPMRFRAWRMRLRRALTSAAAIHLFQTNSHRALRGLFAQIWIASFEFSRKERKGRK